MTSSQPCATAARPTNPNIDSALLNAGHDLSIMELMVNHLVSRPPVARVVKNAPDWVEGCLLIDEDDVQILGRLLYLLKDDVEEIRQAHRAEEAAHV